MVVEKTYLAEKGLQQEIKNVVDTTKINLEVVDALVDDLLIRLGAPTTTASNVTSGNAHAKLNWLLTNVATLVAGRVVKSVQRGMSAGTNSNPLVISINTVTHSKCLVIIDGVINYSSNQYLLIQELKTTQLLITKNPATGSIIDSVVVGWQVIEFY